MRILKNYFRSSADYTADLKELFAKVDIIRQNSLCIRRQSKQLARAVNSTLVYAFNLSVMHMECICDAARKLYI